MKSIITLLLVFIGSTAFSQSLTANELNDNWTLLTEQDGIKMFVQKGECQMGNVETPFTYGFLKVENTTGSTKHVNFNINLFYTDGCAGCDNHNEEYSSVTVAPNSTIVGDCTFEEAPLALLIRNPLQTDYQEFKQLSLIDLKVD